MQIQIESTEIITSLDGFECRLWKGVTADGIECKVFVHRIAVDQSFDLTQFDRDLAEQLPPANFCLPFNLVF